MCSVARSRGASSEEGGDLDVQTLTLSLQTRPVTGILLESWANYRRRGVASGNADRKVQLAKEMEKQDIAIAMAKL